MVLIGLLLLALACLVLGLVLASAAWLLGSLAASVAAAFVLWQTRERIGAPAAAHTAKGVPAARATSGAPAPAEPQGRAGSGPASLATDAEGGPDPDYLARRAAWFAEGAGSGDVWVVDGLPDYHRAGCAALRGTAAEPIPRSQAIQDGFTPCATCTPDVGPVAPADPVTATAGPPESGSPGDRPEPGSPAGAPPGAVWVIDGRPRYHRETCMIISGQAAEAVPHAQARADGFMPCTLCEPDTARS